MRFQRFHEHTQNSWNPLGSPFRAGPGGNTAPAALRAAHPRGPRPGPRPCLVTAMRRVNETGLNHIPPPNRWLSQKGRFLGGGAGSGKQPGRGQ